MAMLVGMRQQAPNEQSQLTIAHVCAWHDPVAACVISQHHLRPELEVMHFCKIDSIKTAAKAPCTVVTARAKPRTHVHVTLFHQRRYFFKASLAMALAIMSAERAWPAHDAHGMGVIITLGGEA